MTPVKSKYNYEGLVSNWEEEYHNSLKKLNLITNQIYKSTAKNRMSYIDRKLYSYDTLVATLNTIGDRTFILITNRTYSITTTKQLKHVQRLYTKCIIVPDIRVKMTSALNPHIANLGSFILTMYTILKDILKKQNTKSYNDTYKRIKLQLLEYIAIFNLSHHTSLKKTISLLEQVPKLTSTKDFTKLEKSAYKAVSKPLLEAIPKKYLIQ